MEYSSYRGRIKLLTWVELGYVRTFFILGAIYLVPMFCCIKLFLLQSCDLLLSIGDTAI